MTKHLPISIIGAGTAGLATAILLAQKGMDVDLFEEVKNTSPVGAGILLQPQGMFVLKELDLLQETQEISSRINSLSGETKNGKLIMDFHYADLHPDLFGLGIHRGQLFRILLAKAVSSGVNLHFGKRIIDIKQTDEAAFVVTKEDVSKPYSTVVIANGSWSNLTSNLLLKKQHKLYPWGALWKIFEDVDVQFANELTQKYDKAHTMVGMLPTGINPKTGKNCVSFFWSLEDSQYQIWRENNLEQWQQKVYELWPELEPWIIQDNSHHNYTYARYADTVMNQWHDNRVVVIGDAAHAMSPQLGQGANMALTDAMVLANCLLCNQDIHLGLQQYSHLRKKHIRYYQWASRFLTPLFQSNSWLGATFRDVTFPPMKYIPIAKKHALATLFGVKSSFFSARSNIALDHLAKGLSD